ncbi:MAG: hypothetical protein V1774_10985 [Candidatus Eisenbacteria bacterium]
MRNLRHPAMLLLWLLLPAVIAGADDRVIDRPMRLRIGPRVQADRPAGPLAAQGRPSVYDPRNFPAVLRDPRLAQGEPDGIFWRRLHARHPSLDARELLTLPPAGLKQRSAEARAAAQPDTVRILALRVDFLGDGAGAGSSTPDGRFDLRDSTGALIDPAPHNRTFFASHMEALRRYYDQQSGGMLALTWEIYPAEEDSAYHLSDTADYGPWIMSSDDQGILTLAERLVRDGFAMAESSDAPPDFRRFDSFWLIHAGPDFQGDINRDTPYDIPSFNIFLAEAVAVQDSTFFIDLILVVPETVTQDGYTGALNGVLAHEFGHQIGFFDLYNVLNFYPMVGMFSLMDSGEQLFGTIFDEEAGEEIFVRGAIPASIDPWTKLIFFPGGVQATWIAGNQRVDLPAVQVGNDIALVPIGGQGLAEDPWFDAEGGDPWRPELLASEYFIMENRPYDLNGDGTVILERDDSTGVVLGPANLDQAHTDSLGLAPDTLGQREQDYLLPGGGVLIWHVDNAAIQAASSVCYGCINITTERQGVDVEEADGIQDLGDIYSVEWVGGKYDYWFPNGYTSFGPQSDPNSASGGGGATGIRLDVADSTDLTMRMDVHRGWVRPGWPRYVALPPSPEGVNPVDLDYDGVPEILTAGGAAVFALDADGNAYEHAAYGDGLFAEPTDSLLRPGIAVHRAFIDPFGEAEILLAAATGTEVLVWDRFGDERMRYPGGAAPSPALRFTTPPLMLDSIVVVGDSDGRLRGLRPGAENELLWRTPEPGYPISALAAGDLFGNEGPALAWGNTGGQVFVAAGNQRGGFTPGEGWPRTLAEGDSIAWLLAIEGPAGEPGNLLVLGASGRMGLFGADGRLLAGWPRALGGRPAGAPVVGDPDGDGALEIVATTEEGWVHLYTLAGDSEPRWPRSVWHPDGWAFGRVLAGPVIADVTDDGVPEILQGSADGIIHALMGGGEEVAGWPLAAGFSISTGPLVAATGAEGGLQLLAADAAGFATILDIGLPAREISAGEMWRGDGDEARTYCFPRERRTDPVIWSGLWDESSLLFAPNPIVGTQGALRVRMGVAGTLRLRLFDTSGQRVWEGSHEVGDVTQPVVWELDLAGVAPGLYVAAVAAEGDGESREVIRKLAVVR